jgi:hypothetical protein
MNRRLLPILLTLPLLLGAAPPAIQAEDWGPLFRGAHPRVHGLDGAFSLSVGPGRSLWSFGDTLVGTVAANGDRTIAEMPFNTAAIIEDRDVLQGAAHARFIASRASGIPSGDAAGANPGPVLPGPAVASHRVWPLDLVKVGDRFWHYYVTIAPFGTGPLDFKVAGTGVAAAKASESPRFGPPKALWPGEAPSFGASVLAHGEWLYVYAGGADTHVARVAPDRLDQPGSYRYYAGEGRWSADWKAARALPGSGPELSVRWNAYLQAFVMIYVPPFGKTIAARFAPSPEGPWSAPKHVANCQPAHDPVAMFYGAKQHAQLDVDGGRQIFLSYNTNTPPDRLDDRPDLYWPRLVRVTFGANAAK